MGASHHDCLDGSTCCEVFNRFPWKGGVKLYSPGEIMTGWRLHADDLWVGFGTYCQVAEHVEPISSLAPWT